MFVINQPIVGVSDYFWNGYGWSNVLGEATRFSTRAAAKAMMSHLGESPKAHSRPLTVMQVES